MNNASKFCNKESQIFKDRNPIECTYFNVGVFTVVVFIGAICSLVVLEYGNFFF